MLSESILQQFPPVEFAFAYGSGVIEQTNHSNDSETLIDIVLVVNNSQEWHELNLKMNPQDYTSILPLPANMITCIQESMGGRIWYNVYIPIKSYPNRKMKYGVMSKEHLLRDLVEWKWLYISGRLHKPVQILKENLEIQKAIAENYHNAVKTALLLMPKSFSEIELFRGIASLSYIGDPRMIAGENPLKVVNLVSATALPLYRRMYEKAILKLQSDSIMSSTSPANFSQDMSVGSRWKLVNTLPLKMQSVLHLRDRANYLLSHPPGNTAIRSALATIVARAATSQSIKGLITAGLVKCSSYILAKVVKRFDWLRGMKTYVKASANNMKSAASTSRTMSRMD